MREGGVLLWKDRGNIKNETRDIALEYWCTFFHFP